MPTETHPQSRLAGELFDLAIRKIGVVDGSRFMFSANPYLDGTSPIEALKAGRDDAVKRAILNLGSQR